MKKIKLIALRNIYYDRDLKTGEEFEATEEHAAAIVRAGSAKVSEEKQKPGRYERRDMRAAS